MSRNTTPEIESAGRELLNWAFDQVRMREIVGRPWGVYDGRVRGELVYHAPMAVRPPLKFEQEIA